MLANQVKPIVNGALRKLTATHPEWACKTDVSVVLPPNVFDIFIEDRKSGKTLSMLFTRFDAQSLIKAPQESATDNLVNLVELEANKVFKTN